MLEAVDLPVAMPPVRPISSIVLEWVSGVGALPGGVLLQWDEWEGLGKRGLGHRRAGLGVGGCEEGRCADLSYLHSQSLGSYEPRRQVRSPSLPPLPVSAHEFHCHDVGRCPSQSPPSSGGTNHRREGVDQPEQRKR